MSALTAQYLVTYCHSRMHACRFRMDAHYNSFLTAMACMLNRERAERAEQKQRDEADKAWRRLLRAVLTRVRVAADYALDDGA